ncbi:outer membrane protein assembly factor BamB family protein [Streptomyces herbicida]|uniref:outer membrane protein assembly factor BamB family protein n=1 Tax=Streptomyces herbicida TaxID=3065675 RepID=UPI00292D610C|nr:PQQ-binding-like beta-propeller repeat protein [Streptomyces sp. NEAU-HV9]
MSFGPPPSVYTQSTLAADQATRKRRRAWLWGALAVLVVVGLVATGLFLSFAGDDSAHADGRAAAVAQSPDAIRETVEKVPSSPEGQLAVEHDEKDVSKSTETNPRYAPGTWATGKILARGVANRIVGLRIKPPYDETAWTLKLDGHICATSRHVTADGRTAVVIQPPHAKGSKQDGVCDQVVFFDLNTGKKLWQKKMPSPQLAYVTNTNLTLTKGVVAVAWGHGSVAYDMKDGRKLWDSATVSRCEDKGFAGGRALLALVACGEGTAATYEVQKLDPRTGKPRWTYKVASGVSAVYLPSSDPPVLAVGAGDSEATDLISLDAGGRRLATVSLSGYDAKCGTRYFSSAYFGVLENCDGLVVGRTQVYVMSKENISNDQPSDWIVAFDLKTGKSQGKFDGRNLQMIYPLRMSGDELLIYRRGAGVSAPAAVVSWNARTDKETPLLFFQLPEDDDAELSDPEQSDIVFEQGRVFFGKRELVRDDKYPKDSVLMAIGIGSAGLKH